MISFLTSPKSFVGRTGDIQRRAIESWLRSSSHAQVILYGQSAGAAEIAIELGIVHIPTIESTRAGVPYFDAIVQHAERYASHDLQVYLNCDILMPPDLLERVRVVGLPRFLLTGQRADLKENVTFNFAGSEWLEELLRLDQLGLVSLHGPTGMDYFVFRRGLWRELRPLIIGRAGYDCALLAYCMRRGIPVIDATESIPALHQFHDYDHLRGGLREAHFGDDAAFNYDGHDVRRSPPNIADAQLVLTRGALEMGNCRGDRLRRLEVRLRYQGRQKLASLLIRAIWRVRERMLDSRVRSPQLAEMIEKWRTAYVYR